jgi:hypothetical protein
MIASFTAPATSTLSIWIKLNSAGTKTFVFSDSGGDTKTISGTDWQRIDATFVGAGGEFRIGLIGGSSSDTLDCSIWGAQTEASSYPTSYIPTTSSSATRVADACFKTGISSLIGQTEGVLFLDVTLDQRVNYTYFAIAPNLGSAATYIGISMESTRMQSEIVNSGVQASISFSNSSTGRFKAALAYKANDVAFYVNGTLVGTDTSATIPACSQFALNNFDKEAAPKYNQVALFPTRLTNAELASLTTL